MAKESLMCRKSRAEQKLWERLRTDRLEITSKRHKQVYISRWQYPPLFLILGDFLKAITNALRCFQRSTVSPLK